MGAKCFALVEKVTEHPDAVLGILVVHALEHSGYGLCHSVGRLGEYSFFFIFNVQESIGDEVNEVSLHLFFHLLSIDKFRVEKVLQYFILVVGQEVKVGTTIDL